MTRIMTLTAAIILGLGAQQIQAAEPVQTGMTQLMIQDTQGARHLKGFVWFPAQGAAKTVSAHGNAVWQSIKVAPDAAPVEGSYPLVVLSHGMFGNARNQAWLAEKLVAAGYVVAAIDHPGTSTFQRDPDMRKALWDRSGDISRVIDHMIADDGLQIDAERIYMAGHSLGGFTAMTLAGARYSAEVQKGFCANNQDDLACGIFQGWNVAQTPEDIALMEADLSDERIKAFAVFDLGGTQSLSAESLGAVARPLIVYGAEIGNSGIDLDIEARALVAQLPAGVVTYHEPAGLAHFDFLGQCTAKGLAILKEEEPQDAMVCENGQGARAAHHQRIAAEVADFFGRY